MSNVQMVEDYLKTIARTSKGQIVNERSDSMLFRAGSDFNLEFLKQRRGSEIDQQGPFQQTLFMLVFMICDLQAATIKLRDVIGCVKKPEFSDFVLFLQLAEVYGSGYHDDVDYAKFN